MLESELRVTLSVSGATPMRYDRLWLYILCSGGKKRQYLVYIFKLISKT